MNSMLEKYTNQNANWLQTLGNGSVPNKNV